MIIQIRRMLVWPFQSLFWKLFLWFWLTMLSMMAAMVIAVAITVNPSDFLSERRELFRELEIVSRKVERMASGWAPHTPFPQFSGSYFYLFDPAGEVVGRRAAPDELMSAYDRTHDRTEPTITFRSGVVVVGPRKVWIGRIPYDLFLTKEMPRLVHWRVTKVLSQQWHLVIIALAVSFLLCIMLARYLVVPIRRLQVTSRKLAKGELSARVEASVRQRGDELGEFARDFDHMAEQLETLVNNKEILLRNVSHELRSPLTRLQISLALARRKTPEAEAEHGRIEREIERLDELIGEIIRFSRIQHGLSEMACERVNLEQLIEQLVDDGNFEAQAQNKGVDLIKSQPIEIVGVRDWLSSAAENIIRNAIRFTPQGSDVEVTLEQYRRNVIIKVRDKGPGVPEDALESMFEPFFRVDETRGKENDGFGLGTAIAMSAIANHDGAIFARNAHPGLEVTIRIPLDHKHNV
ncbi:MULTISPECIES: ATP-binding protein [unclassified Endozoicomonas]|uniref:ATP-binding protein n=1 Tax=unclassified Endozoicomonas TaxID=2644528 RepID=UPI002148F0AD|nr:MULTISPECIES: ATP-binding protein [unclassified Endozoicomonas]